MTLNLLICLIAYAMSQPAPAPAPEPPVNPPPLPPLPPPLPASYCTGSNTGGYDLTPITGKTQKYAFQPDKDTQNLVVFSVCGYVNQSCSSEAGGVCYASNCCGVCQQFPAGGDGEFKVVCLGVFSGARPYGSSVEIFYTGGQPIPSGEGPAIEPGPRRAIITLGCGVAGPNGEVHAEGFDQAPGNTVPNQNYTYPLKVSHPLLCGGIGFGGVALILMFVGAIIYVVGGVVYNKFVLQKEVSSPMELIPNFEFWVETPSLFLAGISFTKSKIFSAMGREDYSSL